MRRLVPLALLVLVMTAAGAAASYDTILYTDELNTDFSITGDVWSHQLDSGKVGVTVTYDLVLTNDAYNRTSLEDFLIGVRNGTGMIAATYEATGDIEHGEVYSGYVDLTIPSRVEGQRRVVFRINHTATLADGSQVDRRVRGSVAYEYEARNGTIGSLTTNASAVPRGGRVYVNGTAQRISTLTVQGRTFAVTGYTFTTWLPVPANLSTGTQNLSYTFTTATGHRITRSVLVTVTNQAPSIRVGAPDTLVVGDELRITYTATDAHGNASVALTGFTGGIPANMSHDTAGDRFIIQTDGMATGTYTFNVTATDAAGATATASGNVTLILSQDGTGQGDGDGQDTGQGQQDGGDGQGQEQSQPDSIPIIGAIREFMVNLIAALLGFNSA